MSISREEINKIAQLAHLGFESAELERFAPEFARILGYLESLERLSLEGVEPTSHMTGAEPTGEIAHRPDQERSGLPAEEALREAPEQGDGHFLVPRFIG
jgi:aspartyl-tRNA(Asn)/glutamyl-tRNA(Gln) amidotransferase subunit C